MNEPRTTQTDPMTVACLAMTGAYTQMPAAFGRLYGGLAALGLTPAGMPRAVFLTDPASVPETQARWELWAPVTHTAQAASGGEEAAADRESATAITVREIPARTLAVIVHKGPYEAMAPTYARLLAWVAAQGYEIAGPPEEAYLTDPGATAPEDTLTEVAIPVRA